MSEESNATFVRYIQILPTVSPNFLFCLLIDPSSHFPDVEGRRLSEGCSVPLENGCKENWEWQPGTLPSPGVRGSGCVPLGLLHVG